MHLRAVKAGDGSLLKAITLRSVEEAPYAFGGLETLHQERERPDAQWDELAAECGGDVKAWRDRCVGYLIMDSDKACAKALGYLSANVPGLAHMSGVWVDPQYRRQGLGRWLVHQACDWAASKGATRLLLWVDDTNPGAVGFYCSLGFRPTGESRPVSPTSSDRERSLAIALPVIPRARKGVTRHS
jgi:ribosomal protein S18 acetylase RimI-like enzyme